jgi:hypothetical protein
LPKSKFKVGDIVVVTNLIKQGTGAYNRYLFQKGTITWINDWKSDGINVRFTRTTSGQFFQEELLLVTEKTDLKLVKVLYGKK